MQPSDRTIRDELRREAMQVPIPDAMWDEISRRLELDREQPSRVRHLTRRAVPWKPALALTAVAGCCLAALTTFSAGWNKQAEPLVAGNHSTASLTHPDELELWRTKAARRQMARVALQDHDWNAKPEGSGRLPGGVLFR